MEDLLLQVLRFVKKTRSLTSDVDVLGNVWMSVSDDDMYYSFLIAFLMFTYAYRICVLRSWEWLAFENIVIVVGRMGMAVWRFDMLSFTASVIHGYTHTVCFVHSWIVCLDMAYVNVSSNSVFTVDPINIFSCDNVRNLINQQVRSTMYICILT